MKRANAIDAGLAPQLQLLPEVLHPGLLHRNQTQMRKPHHVYLHGHCESVPSSADHSATPAVIIHDEQLAEPLSIPPASHLMPDRFDAPHLRVLEPVPAGNKNLLAVDCDTP
ncbi:MAG: hypothetical protein Q9216_001987 [Gyalolechia sp. 2 TL-2023]